MIKLSTVYKNHHFLPVLLLIVLAVLTHILWFTPGSIITSSDWGHYQDNVLKELYKTAGTWESYDALGNVNVQIPFYIFMGIWSLLGNIGLTYDSATKITFFIPIAILGFISPYVLFNKITKNRLSAFIAALFYGTTTYGISNQPPIHFVYTISPLVIYFFIKAFESSSAKRWIAFLLLYSLGIVYEVRIMYIVSAILVLYVLLFQIQYYKKFIIIVLSIAPLAVLLNFYWLLPTLNGAVLTKIGAVANRGLFGNNLFDISHAIALSNWYWTGGVPNNAFIKQSIPFYLWAVPALIVIGLIKFRFSVLRQWTIFFLILSLIGIFLTKQIDQPLTGAYLWLYEHFPGFSLFRESSKFFLITSLGYAGILSIICLGLYKNVKKPYVTKTFAGLIIVLCLVNTYPLVSGKIGGLFVNRSIPKQYTDLNSELSSSTYGRTFSVPATSRWMFYSGAQPKISAVNASQNDFSIFSKVSDPRNNIIQTSIVEPLQKTYSPQLFNLASIRYVIVPLRDFANDDDFYKFYGNDRQFYIRSLDTLPWLRKIQSNTQNITVYENLNYSPYFTTSTKLNSVANIENIDDLYAFQSNGLNDNSLNFVVQTNKLSAAPTRQINDISSDLTTKNFTTKVLNIEKAIDNNMDNTLYSDIGIASFSYTVDDQIININRSNANELTVNDTNIGADLTSDTVGSVSIEPSKEYYLSEGEQLNIIDRNSSKTRNVGLSNDPLSVYSSSRSSNLVTNSNFEQGQWKSTVDDCNPYDSHPNISMGINSSNPYSGEKSLQLGSMAHVACTRSNTFKVSEDSLLRLDYHYFIHGGQRAGYELRFNNSKNTVIADDQFNTRDRWVELNKIVKVPEGATEAYLVIKGYPDDNGKQYATTSYDDVVITPVAEELQIQSQRKPSFVETKLTTTALQATINSKSYSYDNLIQNPSLENGLWQKKVGDCNAYDKNPILSMGLNHNSVTDGKNSLELTATRHVACTGPPSVDVKEGTSYLFSFDYKSPTRSEAGYYISFNDPSGTVVSERIPTNDEQWHTFKKQITIPFGATSMSISIYSYADELSGVKKINYYDNFSFTQIPHISNRYYLVSTPKNFSNLVRPQKINFDDDSQTRKIITVNKASTPFYLTMSESYHPQWRLELNDSRSNAAFSSFTPWAKVNAVADENHFNYDNFINSWYVDPTKLCASGSTACTKNADGSYDLKLIAEFTPQRYFYVGLIISGITLVGCVGFLSYTGIRKLRTKREKVCHEK